MREVFEALQASVETGYEAVKTKYNLIFGLVSQVFMILILQRNNMLSEEGPSRQRESSPNPEAKPRSRQICLIIPLSPLACDSPGSA